jgi:hypothetical protein
VNEALSRWDEVHAAAAMPGDLRPPPVRQPSVCWPALKELQGMLGEVLGELEEAWERRNWTMVRAALWAACCLVLAVVVAFGLLREDRYVLAIGAVGWALAAAQFAGPGWRR